MRQSQKVKERDSEAARPEQATGDHHDASIHIDMYIQKVEPSGGSGVARRNPYMAIHLHRVQLEA
jgi:hypothetical protein